MFKELTYAQSVNANKELESIKLQNQMNRLSVKTGLSRTSVVTEGKSNKIHQADLSFRGRRVGSPVSTAPIRIKGVPAIIDLTQSQDEDAFKGARFSRRGSFDNLTH